MAEDSESVQGIDDDKYDDNNDEYDYKDDDEDEYSVHSGFSDAFEGLELMKQIDQIEETAEQIGLAFDYNGFYQNLATLNSFVDVQGDDENEKKEEQTKTKKTKEDLWKCQICHLLNYSTTLRCKACFTFNDLVEKVFNDDIIITFISFLDGATLINFYLCNIPKRNQFNAISKFIKINIERQDFNFQDVDNEEFPEVTCIIDKNCKKTFKEWTNQLFDTVDIYKWGQSFNIKWAQSGQNKGDSFLHYYIPFNFDKINEILKWLFSGSKLKSLSVYGIKSTKKEVRGTGDRTFILYRECMIAKNNNLTHPWLIIQSDDFSYC